VTEGEEEQARDEDAVLVVLGGEIGEGELAGVCLDVHAGEVVVELVPEGDVDAEVEDLPEREKGGREREQQDEAAREGMFIGASLGGGAARAKLAGGRCGKGAVRTGCAVAADSAVARRGWRARTAGHVGTCFRRSISTLSAR
jgi:hypothetical protein